MIIIIWHNLSQTTRPIYSQQKMRICWIVDFAIQTDHRVKIKESKKRDKYVDLAGELKKLWNMKVTDVLIVINAFGTIPTGLVKTLEDFKNQRTSGDHPDYCIIKIGYNTEKSPGDLRKLAVIQTPMKDH